jgi:ankyrin repeat protein
MDKEEFLRYLASASQTALEELAFKTVRDSSYSEFLKLLITKQFVSNPLNHKGQTLLHCAVICNNVIAVDILLDLRFDPNDTDDEERTALHFAVVNGVHHQIISMLIKNNADINAKTERMETPLFLACSFNNVKAVELLLQNKNCDINFPNDIGQEPKYIAYKNNNKEIISLLQDFFENNKITE